MDGTCTTSRKTHLRPRRAASLVLAALALGAGAVPAAAEGVTERAQAIAAAHWGADACAGTVTVAWAQMPTGTNATSNWSNPESEYGAPARNTACVITFNSTLQWDWTSYCSVLVHEYGHLTGHAHAADEADVMFEFYVEPVPACKAAQAAKPKAAKATKATRKTPKHRKKPRRHA